MLDRHAGIDHRVIELHVAGPAEEAGVDGDGKGDARRLGGMIGGWRLQMPADVLAAYAQSRLDGAILDDADEGDPQPGLECLGARLGDRRAVQLLDLLVVGGSADDSGERVVQRRSQPAIVDRAISMLDGAKDPFVMHGQVERPRSVLQASVFIGLIDLRPGLGHGRDLRAVLKRVVPGLIRLEADEKLEQQELDALVEASAVPADPVAGGSDLQCYRVGVSVEKPHPPRVAQGAARQGHAAPDWPIDPSHAGRLGHRQGQPGQACRRLHVDDRQRPVIRRRIATKGLLSGLTQST
ncbi:MAG: hypothetical protein ACE5K7_04115, partial [Phycisphaerae bacterium]